MKGARRTADCARFVDDLALLAGGDAPVHKLAVVDAHLASCAACRDELGALRGALRGVVGATPLVPDFSPTELARLHARTMAAVRAEARMPAVWWRRTGFSLAGVLTMAVVALLGLPRLARRGHDTLWFESAGSNTSVARVEAPGLDVPVDDGPGEDLWATLIAREADDNAAPAPVRRMKIELRTQDPAIRIVWLTPN